MDPKFAIRAGTALSCSSNEVDFIYDYDFGTGSVVLRITKNLNKRHNPPYILQLLQYRPSIGKSIDMNDPMSNTVPDAMDYLTRGVDTEDLYDLPTDVDAENSSASRPTSDANSASGEDQTDDESEDLLKYIRYLDKLAQIEKIAAEHLEKERADGTRLLKLLDTGDFDQGLIKEFKTMINMVKHINVMLFKGDKESNFKVRPRTLREVEEVAVQVIHYFDKLSDQFDTGIDQIINVKKYLPNLGPQLRLDHIRTALRVWNTKIMGELACPQNCEKRLFEGFAVLFDAQIYHPFMQVRKTDPEHEMVAALTEHFDAINHYVHHTCATYAVLIREHGKFKAAMAGARNRLLANPDAFLKAISAQRTFTEIKDKMEREGAAVIAALEAKSAAAAAAAAAAETTVAAMDQGFKKWDVGEGSDENAKEGKKPVSKHGSKGKRNSKGKSSGKGKGKGRGK